MADLEIPADAADHPERPEQSAVTTGPLPFPPAPDQAGAASDAGVTSDPVAPALPPECDAGALAEPERRADPRSHAAGCWSILLPLSVFFAVLLLAAYLAPALLTRWQLAQAAAEAEAAYQRRHAELKAEAEAADARLDLLDRRTQLVSLGYRELVRKVAPIVVNVTNFKAAHGAELGGLHKRHLIYDPDTDRHYFRAGSGSGLIVKPRLILTNHHVVKEAERLRVTLASGRSLTVGREQVTVDPLTDLAVIRLPADGPGAAREEFDQTAEFANSDKDVEPGDLVVAVGSPLGLRNTVTQGIISAKGRLLPNMIDGVELLQTDTHINPGNSGGPLFDLRGRVVGINVAISSDTGGSQGIGWVIPSNTASEIFTKLAAGGEIVRGFLGVALDNVSPEEARKLRLEDGGGIRVLEVVPDSPAARAKVRRGDVIVAFDKEVLKHEDPSGHLRQKIMEMPIGRRVSVEVLRGGARHTLHVEIGRRPDRLSRPTEK
jgi:S1-C subfamily serine protease